MINAYTEFTERLHVDRLTCSGVELFTKSKVPTFEDCGCGGSKLAFIQALPRTRMDAPAGV